VSLPEASVRRPVTIFVTVVALMVFGFLSFTGIPVELLPDLSYPTLTVQTDYPDAAPTSVEQFVTRPIEEAVGVVAGVREMRSVSRAGLSEVILEFEWNERMDFAAMDVREKLALVELPREAEPSRVLRFDPSLDPIVRLAFRGDRSLDELRQIADRWLKPRLEAIQGVAAAKVRGGLDPEIQVEVDEDRLAALGLTLDDLAQALRAENVNRPGGTLKDWSSVYLVRTLHEFTDLDQLRRTVVRDGPTGRVRVEDVATVRRGHRDRDEITRSEGEEVVEIALHREGSTNTLAVSAAIREALDGPAGHPEQGLRGRMDDDLELTFLTDQSTYIDDAISQVRNAALLGFVIAVCVLYFFLRDLWATLIVGLTIPVSVVVTFLPMYKTGVSLNIMSLGGLALGVGMLVDNSIVVLESIDRRRREGLARREAAAAGAADVAGAVTAATLTTISVFLPIVFVRGVAGQLFYDLAVTVCLALAISLGVSLTLIPMLSALHWGGVRSIALEEAFGGAPGAGAGTVLLDLLHPRHVIPTPFAGARRWWTRALTLATYPLRFAFLLCGWALRLSGFGAGLLLRAALHVLIYAFVLLWRVLAPALDALLWPLTRAFDALGRAYPDWVAAALRARRVVLPLAFALFVGAVAALPLLGTNLVPDLSQGEFAFRVRLPEGTTLESSTDLLARIERRALAENRFERLFSVVGSWPSTASGRQSLGENLAQINFVLPADAGAEDELAAIDRVRGIFALFPDVEAELAHPSLLSMRPPLAVHLFSEDLDDLEQAAETTAEMMWALPAVEDVATSSEPGNPEITIELDRARADDLGVRAEPLSRSLQRQIGGEIVGQFREEEQRLDIRLRASEAWRDRAAEVKDLRYRLENGTIVPVAAFADVKLERGPAAIHRVGGGRVARVTAKVASADLGQALERLKVELRRIDLPTSVVAELAGQDEELQVSFDSLKLALALAVFMVYVVMAVQFESLRYPFVILLAVPLGLVGVVLALWLTDTSLSVLALIGTVMLAGIVVNNAIVLIDAINRRRREGERLDAAIVEAGGERLRPILMTTATTVLALLPMALGLGAGDELRRPLAITVIGGLSVATVLTLVMIPCLYRAMTRADDAPATAPAAPAARGLEAAGGSGT
jgi:HAE1 family hydrophobic/amphiphilic exporter-1